MSTPITHPKTDVVVVGLGVAGGIVATELATNGVKVVGIDKGSYWDYASDWAPTKIHDEWATAMEHPSDHQLSQWSLTLRHNTDQVALPLRRYVPGTNWVMGNGVGGAAVHYGAGMGRYGPWAFQAYSTTINKYGASVLPSNHELEDWPISYDDATPYYNAFEKSWGMAGLDQDPFTPNAKYPLPPHPTTPLGEAFKTATQALGYHPRHAVSAIASAPYMNQYGVSRNACVYCGFCAGGEGCAYYCEVGAKTSTHVSHIPAALKSGNFSLVLNSVVTRINVDPNGKTATGVTYVDAQGKVHIQPATIVYIAAYLINSMRLMFLSGTGKPYDPVTSTGVLGRGFTQGGGASTSNAHGVVNIGGNGYSAGNSGGGGYTIEDFADDNFDHKGLNFIGGANMAAGTYLGGSPHTFTTLGVSVNNLGAKFKASLKDQKLPTSQTVTISPGGPDIPTKDHYTSLDPHYNDVYGDPLLRCTVDFTQNAWNVADYLAAKGADILTKMGASNVAVTKVAAFVNHPNGQNIHYRGGARMGKIPATSLTNKWTQLWDVQNLFAVSESTDTFGDNTTAGTHVIGMMAYIAADGIKKYLQNPGPLA